MKNKELEKNTPWDDLHEECGVFGMYDFDGNDVASTIYYGLFALQHRGQESCGIAVSDTNGERKVLSHKGMGLVNEVFTHEELEKLHGKLVMLKEKILLGGSVVGVFRVDMLECCQPRHLLS